MSIWSSVSGQQVVALDGHEGDANYRAEGDPTYTVDVATARPWHDHIRLGVDADHVDVCALLSPDNARALRDKLTEALAFLAAEHPSCSP
jgi:hypothetical protein